MTHRAVILARGMGTRMRAAGQGDLTAAQTALADAGDKILMPIGRPFLDYLLDGLADAGCTEACLVIGPEHEAIRQHVARSAPERLAVGFATQLLPRGTADAVLAAEAWGGSARFVVINGDNYYPPAVLRTMFESPTPAVAAFSVSGLLREGNLSLERIGAFALLEIDRDGWLSRIVEKPGADMLARAGPAARIGMNCWSFDATIFEACRNVPLSPRGELELPLAVQMAIDAGRMRVCAVPIDASVLDLSRREDVAAVARLLGGIARLA